MLDHAVAHIRPKGYSLADTKNLMVAVGTQVALVNPETCRLCRVGEFGEIRVYSKGSVSFFSKSRDQLSRDRFCGVLPEPDVAKDVRHVRTGDPGFLPALERATTAGDSQLVELQTLFVLGTISETLEVLGLHHFPADIETSIENAHPSGAARRCSRRAG